MMAKVFSWDGIVPVIDPGCRDKLINILESYFSDNVKSRKLLSDGTHRRLENPRR